jgi:hypothetical protein
MGKTVVTFTAEEAEELIREAVAGRGFAAAGVVFEVGEARDATDRISLGHTLTGVRITVETPKVVSR